MARAFAEHEANLPVGDTLGQTLIPVINKLQDVFAQVSPDVRLDLPQVAVIGSQSSGKSSVLEALVGRDFLPRGSNIVTRRPLILQLIKIPPSPAGPAGDWGEFLHCHGKRFHDFDRIRQEILAETDRLVGTNKGVSDKPIRLKIYSSSVLTMTLVDLPGITRVPVGDQPNDIEARVRAMVLDYIAAESCIILAVTPANQDPAASDALELARRADPAGARTIGVLTKLDLMDRGTDAVAALRNEVVPLRLGHVGVVLRSQEDIASRRGMAEARAAERAFFEARPVYAEVAAACGVPRLAAGLNAVLAAHVRAALPALRTRLEAALAAKRAELAVLGDAAPGATPAARGALLLTLLDAYARRFRETLDGGSDALPTDELAGGARLRHVFREVLGPGLDALDPTAELSDADVRTAIRNSGGVRGALLIPEAPFELLTRRAVERLLAPCLQCKEYVHAELLRAAAAAAPPDVARFPALRAVLAEAVEAYVEQGAAPAEAMIRNLVACELAFINTSHPDFIGGNRAIAQVLERQADGSPRGVVAEAGAGRSAGGNPGEVASRGAAAVDPGARARAERAPQPAPNAARRGGGGAPPEPAVYAPGELLQPGDVGEGPGPASAPAPARRVGLAGLQDPSHGGAAAGGSPGVLGGSWFGQVWAGARAGAGAPAPPGAGPVPGTGAYEGGGLARPPATLRVPAAMSDQEAVQVDVTRLLVASYFNIVRRNMQDLVPKALMLFLVNNLQRGLQQHLIHTLYREELFEELMTEREDVAAKRSGCLSALRALRAALVTLEGLPGEMAGRAAASGRWSFKAMLAEVDAAEGRGSPSPSRLGGRAGTPGGAARGGGAAGMYYPTSHEG
ncbi:hypothetical protein ACKKBF_B35615 [Auxenochlorella protothecoides x Auxenochlorella symbiontica]|uniref:Dynamin-related protein 3A n=1 Tax=Auxenochlorella protothecoides TaxID=3075 RepID=A0A1D2A2J2_AUXPR